jgi:SRSO17 transposase
MSERKATQSIPEPLELYAEKFDSLFTRVSQRDGFRQYLVGLLLPAERNKTLTGIVNAEPRVGAQAARVQTLQWFLSESRWDWAKVNERRLELLLESERLKPRANGVLVIDETGDRKDGHKTAHVGRQYLANLGKIDNGVVSVSSLWADEQVYYPLEVEPYTPAAWFEGGKANPRFRTKLEIAVDLVSQALDKQISFRAVVADSFYGEDRGFRAGLDKLGVGYVLALKPSHGWRAPVTEIGSLYEYARSQPWHSAEDSGNWQQVMRTFRDGHTEPWWALEVIVENVYGPQRPLRAVVVTTDPVQLPDMNTWYLLTNLPAPNTKRAASSKHASADVVELVRLYGLRGWVEQSYKQVKHTLGWAHYQVRADVAIRRHWILVWCAFTFCWWQRFELTSPTPVTADLAFPPTSALGTAPKKTIGSNLSLLAYSAAPSPSLARTLYPSQALLDSLLSAAPTTAYPSSPRLAV